MFDVKIDVSGLDDSLRGLMPGGAVQLFVDTEIIKHSDPYVPFDTGMLKNSAWFASEIGQGRIIYDTPYAKKMYNAPEGTNFQNGPLRGAQWVERMWADHGDEIIQGATKIAGGRK